MRLFRFLHGRRGATLILAAISLVVLIGMAALAIDVGQLYIARQRAQNVCDASALAGAQLLTGSEDCTAPDGPPATAAVRCADGNNEMVQSWQVEGFDVTFPTEVVYESDRQAVMAVAPGSAIRTTGYVRVNYGFARIFGFDTKDVWASATAVLGPKKTLTSSLLIPILLSDQIAYQDFVFGDVREFGVVEDWQTGFLGPGNWLSARFEGDQGKDVYIDRLKGTEDPVTVAIGDYIRTETGAATGQDTPSKTYEGLIAKKFEPNGTVKEKNAGRILLEPDPRFQACTSPPEYYRTGYNPDAWDNWVAAKDPATGMYPYSKRIVIMPIIRDSEEAVCGTSTPLEVVGFAAFFITRVYDGVYDSENHLKGDIEGYFIQCIMGTDEDAHWVFPAEGEVVDDPNMVRVVRLIS